MRLALSFLMLVIAVQPSRADAPALADARERLLQGNYAEARAKYQKLLRNAPDRAAATIGLSNSWQAQGEYDKAEQVVAAALKDLGQSADLRARQAELNYLRGRWDEAEKTAEQALRTTKDHFLARWIRAQVWRDRGDLRKADQEFRWFVRTYSERSENDKDITDPEQLVLVALAGAENARWHPRDLSDQFDFILQTVYPDARKADKNFWWAEYHAGMLLLEKHNAAEALASLDKALEINASAAEALVGRGRAHLDRLDMDDAREFARRALAVNPRLTEALRLRADIYLFAGELEEALRFLDRARQVNPREETTLARIAACHFLRHKVADFESIVKEVEKRDSRPGVFYSELAHQLEEHRRYDDAEKFYKKSMALRPMLVAPKANLGLLYMRMGREAEARGLLDRAYELDEYDIRVFNTRKVLKHLDGYEKLQTAHFLIRFDPAHDKVLARFMAHYLEEIYDSLAGQFQYRPKGPILIEVFNKHEMFSGRVIALPDLHTIGACTGRMFTMVSIHDKSKVIAQPFNWVRVLRHEMVHIFNLEQTNFQIPHWYTEGLAVMNEGFPRPPAWNRLLLRRLADKKLLNLDNVNMAFMHPSGAEEWTLAYLQSLLYVEYMKDRYGPRSIGAMLEAYRKGLDTTAAIQQVCRVDNATFEKGYRTYLDKVAAQIKGKVTAPALSLKQLQKALQEKPGDPDLTAQLAVHYLAANEPREARRLAEGVLKKKKNHPLATYVVARLLADSGEDEKASQLLQAAVLPGQPEPKVLALLGKLYFEAGKLAKAAEVYELARKTDPFETEWLAQLARVYARSDQPDKLIGVLKELAPTEADNLAIRRRLARLLLQQGKHADAEAYARQALEIDVLDPEARRTLEAALTRQKKQAALDQLHKLLAD
jgi:tetratricopeptide (TPR) repeat protein